MRRSISEKAFSWINTICLLLISILMLIPLWHVAMYSLSDPTKIHEGGFFLLPRNISFKAYQIVLGDPLILKAYLNTFFVVIVGAVINLTMTFLAAYPLSRRELPGRKWIQYFIFFTMLFSGGLIPKYLLIQQLGMIDSIWSLILPVAVSAYNIFVMRNFIDTLPESLIESGKIDGANDVVILLKIVIPLSKPALAVIGLMYAVSLWNSWFDCIVYINSVSKYTLQPILRQILFTMGSVSHFQNDPELSNAAMPEVVKMAVVMAATIPILVVYPFLQKYFVKGVMIGAVKG